MEEKYSVIRAPGEKDDKKENANLSYNQIIHEIKNYRVLNRDILIYINNLPSNERLQILFVYNEMMDAINGIIEQS